MIVSITGTPGTGKTALSHELERRGFLTRRVEEVASVEWLESGEYTVSEEVLGNTALEDGGCIMFVEGHLSHHLPCERVVVLRCRPDVLRERLEKRDYPEAKVNANVEAEIIDIVLSEAAGTGVPFIQVDNTSSTVSATADRILKYLQGDGDAGDEIDWLEAQ